MAIFHLSAKIISRGKGQSALAASAYRSGKELRDEVTGETKSYKARSDRIVFEGVFAPGDAPAWAKDREQLWNAVERFERRKDAQLAREIEVALPHELTDQQREWLVKDFVREQFMRKGYAADVAIHAPDKGADARNHHAHILVTRRTIGPDGFSVTKDWQFNKAQLRMWREEWAHLANRHLERHGFAARIDHRTLEAQGMDLEPTIHLGPAASRMAGRGAQSDRMEQLRGIMERNDAIRLEHEAERASLTVEASAPTLSPEEEVKKRDSGATDGLDWTDRGGMAAQQKSALEWFEKSQASREGSEPSLQKRSPEGKPKESGLDAYRYREEYYDERRFSERDGKDEITRQSSGLDAFRYREKPATTLRSPPDKTTKNETETTRNGAAREGGLERTREDDGGRDR